MTSWTCVSIPPGPVERSPSHSLSSSGRWGFWKSIDMDMVAVAAGGGRWAAVVSFRRALEGGVLSTSKVLLLIAGVCDGRSGWTLADE